MAVPRVFISSTYYDLRDVRNNIGNFVTSLGYEPIMHERSSVAYTQNQPLEEDCYHEMAGCDMVVCIIGNKFGTQSSSNDLSITMNEINSAIKQKKKVYIFIAQDMYVENRTFEHNQDNGSFKSAYTDDLRIHEFILGLRNNVKIHVIEAFETTDDIIRILKAQFAGLFQHLLAKDASITDAKTAYDLQETADEIKTLISEITERNEEFLKRFDGTIYTTNYALQQIQKYLGIERASIFASDLDSLDDFLTAIGFSIGNPAAFDEKRRYIRQNGNVKYALVLKIDLFDENNKLKDIRNKKGLEENIIWEEVCIDDDLPF